MNEMQEGLAVIGSTGVAQYSSYLSPSGLDPGAAIENVILRAALRHKHMISYFFFPDFPSPFYLIPAG